MNDYVTAGDGIYVDTAGGSMLLPDGLPDWVTADLIAQANAQVAPEPMPAPAPEQAAPQLDYPGAQPEEVASVPVAPIGYYIPTQDGQSVYVAPGQPDWVTSNQLDQHGGIATNAPVTPAANLPPPLPIPDYPKPPSAPSGGLGGVVDRARQVAAGVVQKAEGAVTAAAQDVSGVVSRIEDATKGVIDSLLPTISELALGLTSRFGDLASFVGEKVVDVGTFAATMAEHSASALSVVFDDAWLWLFRALVEFTGIISSPFTDRISAQFSTLQPGTL